MSIWPLVGETDALSGGPEECSQRASDLCIDMQLSFWEKSSLLSQRFVSGDESWERGHKSQHPPALGPRARYCLLASPSFAAKSPTNTCLLELAGHQGPPTLGTKEQEPVYLNIPLSSFSLRPPQPCPFISASPLWLLIALFSFPAPSLHQAKRHRQAGVRRQNSVWGSRGRVRSTPLVLSPSQTRGTPKTFSGIYSLWLYCQRPQGIYG